MLEVCPQSLPARQANHWNTYLDTNQIDDAVANVDEWYTISYLQFWSILVCARPYCDLAHEKTTLKKL
jgi:hypothetical protein